jgi:hypothetical protein
MSSNNNRVAPSPQPATSPSHDEAWIQAIDQDLVEMANATAQYDLPQSYSQDELDYLDKGRAVVANFDSLKHEKLKTSNLVKGEVSIGGDTVSVRVTANIRAPVKNVLAYAMNHNPRYWSILDHEDPSSVIGVLERPNNHSCCAFTRHKRQFFLSANFLRA